MLLLQAASPLPLVPLPASVRRDTGTLPLDRPLAVVGERAEAATLAESLRLDGVKVGKGRKVEMRLMSGMPAEGYRLTVTPEGARIEASDRAGLFYGGQTLRQMVAKDGIPCATIEDAPRFAWRGMMLDVSRHFRPVADVERIIDLNARMKLNVFHWHLTDDGGWRMETRAYPALTRRGAWRNYPPKGKWDYRGINFPGKRQGDEYGGFYTKAQIKAVLAFAAKRHVTVVPEIEMPGHEQAALQSLPWLRCDGVSERRQAVALCAGKETTFEFVRKVLDETMALFPSKWIHIGGDEVEKRDWDNCPRCQAVMQANGLKSAEELQSWFTRRVDAYLASKGRRLIGWDEILEGGLTQQPISTGATVMSWRGVGGGIAAAKAGHDVMSPTSHLYLDYSYDNIPTERVYGYDPVPPELTPDEAKHVLGAQGNVWTEWLPDEADVEQKAYPRAAALAEAVWTPLARKSWPDFSARLGGLLAVWDGLGVAYRLDPPALPRTTFLSDEPVALDLAPVRPGWALAINAGATLDALEYPSSGAPGRVRLSPGQAVQFSFLRPSDKAVSPGTWVRVARGERRGSTDGLTPGLVVTGIRGDFHEVSAFSGPGGQTVSTIDLAARPAPERFALRFTGYLRLPKDGDYTFALTSDDGSVLKVGGLTVVDHDGEHAAVPKSGTVWAKAGVYPFELGYFDAGGANALSLTVNGAPIPTDWLWH